MASQEDDFARSFHCEISWLVPKVSKSSSSTILPQGFIPGCQHHLGSRVRKEGWRSQHLHVRFRLLLVFSMVPHPQLCLVPMSGDSPVLLPLQRIGLGHLPGLEEADARTGGGDEGSGAFKGLF